MLRSAQTAFLGLMPQTSNRTADTSLALVSPRSLRPFIAENFQPFVDAVEPISDTRQPALDGFEPLADVVTLGLAVAGFCGWWVPAQQRCEIPGRPVQRDRERFERARTAPALHGVVLQLPNDRLRNLRAIGQIALTHSQFVNALRDRFRDPGQSYTTFASALHLRADVSAPRDDQPKPTHSIAEISELSNCMR